MINSNQKGKRGEREARDLLRSFGFEARRGQQFAGNPDALDVVSNFPFFIESKHVEKLNIWAAMEQAQRDSGDQRPCVFFRRNRSDWYVAFRAADILKELGGTE